MIRTVALGFALATGFGLAAAALFWLSWTVIDPPSWGRWRGEATIVAYFLPGIAMFALMMFGIRKWEEAKHRRYVEMNRRD